VSHLFPVSVGLLCLGIGRFRLLSAIFHRFPCLGQFGTDRGRVKSLQLQLAIQFLQEERAKLIN
jgi:hypothetical protein